MYIYICEIQGSFEERTLSSSVQRNCTKTLRADYDTTNMPNCSLFSWGKGFPNYRDASCNAEPYTGTVCGKQLLAWQECVIGGGEEVFLDQTLMESSYPQKEKEASQFLQFLRKFAEIYCH